MAVDVGCGYVNEPCVTVTVCAPGTGRCQSIPNVLLDTGSYGLRLFGCALSIPISEGRAGSGDPGKLRRRAAVGVLSLAPYAVI
jgi:hypothetical protein